MVRLTDRPDMTLDVYRGRKTTMQQQQFSITFCLSSIAMANNFSDSWFRHLCRLQNIILQFSCRKIYNLESLPFFYKGGGGGGGSKLFEPHALFSFGYYNHYTWPPRL